MDPADRIFTITQIMEPHHTNLFGNVHGGEIMRLMDNAAGCTAIRYSKIRCVAARVDELQFLKPVHISDFVTCTGNVVYTGNTSIVIHVTLDAEDIRDQKNRHRVAEALITYVAVGNDGKPVTVPRFIPETDREKELYEYAKQRREFDNQRRMKIKEGRS